MKQLELELKKRLLIMEGDFMFYHNGRPLKYICKGSELTEEIAKGFQYKNMRIAHNGEYLSSIEEFKFHINNNGYYWGENPKGIKPYYCCNRINCTCLEKIRWQEAESRTFNPDKTLIFEIL